ncbi:MAG: exonuclease SbcCD subunit D [Thermoflexales bacterium]|nr:exonuclease SbcCD subunit D [Thermoflexales bacterium]
MGEPIRVLHFADLHIGIEGYGRLDPQTGLNQRVLDFVTRLKEIVDYAIEHQADAVIFAGDAFKTREPNPTYQRAFARQIMRLSRARIPTVLLVGNHDMPIIETRATALDIFATLDVPYVVVGREEAVHQLETRHGLLQVATVPWPQRSRLLKLDEYRSLSAEQLDQELERTLRLEIERLANLLDPRTPAILTAHFSVSGATYGSERFIMLGQDVVLKQESLCLSAWDYVAMGHIHRHQVVNPGQYPSVVYSGSPERVDFGEADQAKGFCWVEVARGETRWSFVPLHARAFVTIDVDATDEENPTEAALRAIQRRDVTDAIVRVRVRMRSEQEALFNARAVERALSGAHAVAGIGREVIREARSRLGINNPERLTPEQLLERYFVSRNTPPERMRELLELARPLLQEGGLLDQAA